SWMSLVKSQVALRGGSVFVKKSAVPATGIPTMPARTVTRTTTQRRRGGGDGVNGEGAASETGADGGGPGAAALSPAGIAGSEGGGGAGGPGSVTPRRPSPGSVPARRSLA